MTGSRWTASKNWPNDLLATEADIVFIAICFLGLGCLHYTDNPEDSKSN
jgi:hypothetical protein